jgi:hypothetical protein
MWQAIELWRGCTVGRGTTPGQQGEAVGCTWSGSGTVKWVPPRWS